MMTYVALLRGINVGGKKQVAMADLRDLIDQIGFGDARGQSTPQMSAVSTANVRAVVST